MSGRFSGSGRALHQSASELASAQADVEPVCLETLGAASALMQLSSCEPEQHRAAPPSSGSPTRSTGAGGGGGGGGGGSGAHPPPSVNGMQVPQDAQSMFAALAAAPVAANYPGGVPASGMLPSLRFVLDGINSQSVLQQQQHQALAQHLAAAHQQQLLIQQQQHQQQQHMQARSAVGADSLGSAEQKGAGVLAGGTTEGADGGGGDEAKHNKYCHFCQHVKVKRATSMLACVNQECARRFCEHCLVTHLNDSVPKQHEAGSWVCPICRKTCCCAFKTCERNHRHCKAFRYRQRRAEQAAKRSLNAAGGGAARPGNVAAGPVSPSKDAEGGGSPEAAAE